MSESEQIEMLLRKFYSNQDQLRGYIFSAVRDYHATEEILQSIAIVVAQKAAAFDQDRPAIPWFMGIAKNKILQWHSLKGRESRNVSFETLDNCIPHMDSFSEDSVTQRQLALKNCIKRLPNKQKAILELRYMDNNNCSMIADKLGRSIQSIYSLLKRLKLELRKCVEFQLQKEETK